MKQGRGSCGVFHAGAVGHVVSENVSRLQSVVVFDNIGKNLEEEKVVGETRRPVRSSNVNCSHSPAPTLQVGKILFEPQAVFIVVC